MTDEMRDRGPVCECDAWGCHSRLGITWEEYDRIDKKRAVFVADDCTTQLNDRLTLTATHKGFKEYNRDA